MKNDIIFLTDGSQEWRQNGKLHRENGPAIIYPDGHQEWFLNGKLHREDGPAVIFANGRKEWRINGIRHREDGPAVIYPTGYRVWYVNGNEISDEEIKEWREQYNIPENYLEWNTQHKMLFKLRFC